METATALKKRAYIPNPKGRPKGVKEAYPRGKKKEINRLVKLAFEGYVEAVAHEFGRLALHAKFEPTRVSAGREIFERVLGKVPQMHTGEDGEGPIKIIVQWGGRADIETKETKEIEG